MPNRTHSPFGLFEARAMRAFLVLSLLMAPCASANAAGAHHKKPRLKSPSVTSLGFVGRSAPGWAYAAPRPDIRYDDTPSYSDPSKWAVAGRSDQSDAARGCDITLCRWATVTPPHSGKWCLGHDRGVTSIR